MAALELRSSLSGAREWIVTDPADDPRALAYCEVQGGCRPGDHVLLNGNIDRAEREAGYADDEDWQPVVACLGTITAVHLRAGPEGFSAAYLTLLDEGGYVYAQGDDFALVY